MLTQSSSHSHWATIKCCNRRLVSGLHSFDDTHFVNDGQQFDGRAPDTPGVNSSIYERITLELKRRNKDWAWLADQIEVSRSAAGNWKSRGVPATHHAAIAVTLGESVDWVTGIAPPRRQDPEKLSPMALKLAREFDEIQGQAAQLDAFAKIITIIAKARGE